MPSGGVFVWGDDNENRNGCEGDRSSNDPAQPWPPCESEEQAVGADHAKHEYEAEHVFKALAPAALDVRKRRDHGFCRAPSASGRAERRKRHLSATSAPHQRMMVTALQFPLHSCWQIGRAHV